MALTFRNIKGSSLTHTELDNNFRDLYYSASYDGSGLYLYKSQSLNNVTNLPFQAPVGYDYYVQVKAGDAPSGSNALFTGSKNFRFDYRQNVLDVTGSQNITGNLVVGGTVTAEEFITEYSTVAVSTIYKSGSSKFGDTSDDNHAFTGSLEIEGRLQVTGPTTQSGDITISGNTTQVGNITLTGEVTQSGNYRHTGVNTHIGNNVHTGTNTQIGNYNQTGNVYRTGTTNLNGDTSITGSIVVTGRVTAEEYHTEFVSSSIIFNSGSTLFGNSSDDTHVFTGSLLVTNGITGSINFNSLVNRPTLLSSSAQIASDISGSINSLTSSFFTSASVFLNTLTFTKGNGTTADITIHTGSGDGGVTIINDGNDRLVTANGNSTINAEDVLTFDGTTLTINSSSIRDFNSSDTDITGLVNGTTFGTLIQSTQNGHIVLGIRDDNTSDSFAVVSGDGDFYSGNQYTKLAFQVSGSGQTYVGGNLSVSGSITAQGDITAFASSDAGLKDNVTVIENAIDKINQIGGYEFDWNSNSEHSGHDVGVIAQEIQKVLPEIVVQRTDGFLAVRYEKIVALLIQAVKEQQLQIEELKSKL